MRSELQQENGEREAIVSRPLLRQCVIARLGPVPCVEPLVRRHYLSTGHFCFPKTAARISASRTGVGFHRPPLTTNRL